MSRREVVQLADTEHVPLDIARTALEGGLSCQQWRAQNPAEASRWDRIYGLIEAVPGMSFESAMELERRGVTVDSLAGYRQERDRRKQISKARATIPAAAIDAFRRQLIADKVDLIVAYDRRMEVDRLVRVDTRTVILETAGEVPALDIVLLAPREAWLGVGPRARFHDELFKSPASVDAKPFARPVADPTPFPARVGQPLALTLRNGMIFTLKLVAAGPYDVIIGDGPKQLLIPLHAIVAWEPAA